MIKVEKREFLGWKNCLSISNGKMEVIVTTDVGPRIISCTLAGKGNHMAVMQEQCGKTGGDDFNLYGGHRVWHAPEITGLTDLPDNSACGYVVHEKGALVMSDNEKTKLSKGMNISLSEDGELTVDNIIRNNGLFDVELSIWALTQFDPSGFLAVPTSTLNTGLIANRTIALWPYSKTTDSRVYYGDSFITLKPDKNNSSAYKFGISDDEQRAYYFNFGQLVEKRFDYYFDVEYPNYGCNFESYANDRFIEIESLSPLFTLEAGEESIHTEKWFIYDNVPQPDAKDEKAIKEIIAKHTGKSIG